MSLPALKSPLVVMSLLGVLVAGAASHALLAQSTTTADRVAKDSDVQGAERLFSAWLEGQVLSRHLPGIAVSVVTDQNLV